MFEFNATLRLVSVSERVNIVAPSGFLLSRFSYIPSSVPHSHTLLCTYPPAHAIHKVSSPGPGYYSQPAADPLPLLSVGKILVTLLPQGSTHSLLYRLVWAHHLLAKEYLTKPIRFRTCPHLSADSFVQTSVTSSYTVSFYSF